jgi:hypothetical protein
LSCEASAKQVGEDGPQPKRLARRGGRKLLGFHVALFAVLGLVIAGALLYKPLELRYAVYKVQRTRYSTIDDIDISSSDGSSPPVAGKWMNICLDAAKRGNRLAMETIVDKHSTLIAPGTGTSVTITPGTEGTETVGHVAACRQSELFFEVLDRRDDGKVLETLVGAACQCFDLGDRNAQPEDIVGMFRAASFRHKGNRRLGTVAGLKDAFVVLKQARAPETRRIAECALDLLRRRFRRELEKIRGSESAKKPPE